MAGDGVDAGGSHEETAARLRGGWPTAVIAPGKSGSAFTSRRTLRPKLHRENSFGPWIPMGQRARRCYGGRLTVGGRRAVTTRVDQNKAVVRVCAPRPTRRALRLAPGNLSPQRLDAIAALRSQHAMMCKVDWEATRPCRFCDPAPVCGHTRRLCLGDEDDLPGSSTAIPYTLASARAIVVHAAPVPVMLGRRRG